MTAYLPAPRTARFRDVFFAEWLKQRRSLASWMVACGAFFTPLVILSVRLYGREQLPALYAREDFWIQLWRASWESSAVFFLPIGAILATSLIVQIEYRNNAWKQLRTLPTSDASVYLAKLLIVVLMLAQFLALFVVAIWLSAAIPAWIVPGLAMPTATIDYGLVAGDLLGFFVGCLPIVALQYALSIQLSNFMAPLGIGFLLWVGSLAALSSRWVVLSPYSYTILHYLGRHSEQELSVAVHDLPTWSLTYTVLFVAAGYLLFYLQRQKG